jgi:hypothetical protein
VIHDKHGLEIENIINRPFASRGGKETSILDEEIWTEFMLGEGLVDAVLRQVHGTYR